MALLDDIYNSIALHWTWLVVLVAMVLTVKLILKNNRDPLNGLPEIKPHWFWGNLDLSKHLYLAYNMHYQRMKGLRYGIFYHFNEKRLFVLDPDIISKIMITDFDHFEYAPFFPKQYSEVRTFS